MTSFERRWLALLTGGVMGFFLGFILAEVSSASPDRLPGLCFGFGISVGALVALRIDNDPANEPVAEPDGQSWHQ